jgi:formylglycine-generating enzyme
MFYLLHAKCKQLILLPLLILFVCFKFSSAVIVSSSLCAEPPPKTAAKAERESDGSLITNSIGMKLTLVPAGEFLMGWGESAESIVKVFQEKYGAPFLTSERFQQGFPQHRVRITRPLYFGTYHVTVGQFRKFVEDTGYRTTIELSASNVTNIFSSNSTANESGEKGKLCWKNPGFEQTDEHPVVWISWNDASAFCKWLSEKKGEQYRLPTEAEWEYACRAGNSTRYAFGDNPEELVKFANIGDMSTSVRFKWFSKANKTEDGYPITSPVGQFKPNAFGLFDMNGNAWQWCWDWYKADYYLESPTEDPTGPGHGYRARGYRVLRGGSWLSHPWECCTAYRSFQLPTERDCFQIGFRVVRSVNANEDSFDLADRVSPTDEGVAVSIVNIKNKMIRDQNTVQGELQIQGRRLDDVKAVRRVINEAIDERGNRLTPPSRFEEFQTANPIDFWLDSVSQVKSLKALRGHLQLMLPSKDPESVVTINFTKEFGFPVKRDALKPGVIEITLNKLLAPSPEDGQRKAWTVTYLLKDPYGKVIGNPEFLDDKGSPLETFGPWGGGSDGTVLMTVVFKAKPPDNFLVRFHVATDKSLIFVPFEFKDVEVAHEKK